MPETIPNASLRGCMCTGMLSDTTMRLRVSDVHTFENKARARADRHTTSPTERR